VGKFATASELPRLDDANEMTVPRISESPLYPAETCTFRIIFALESIIPFRVAEDLRVYKLGISTAIVLRINLVSISIFLVSVIFFVWICILSRRWICIRITFLDTFFSAIFFVWICILSRRFFLAIFPTIAGIVFLLEKIHFSALGRSIFRFGKIHFPLWEDPIINYCGFGHYLELEWSLVYRSLNYLMNR